MYIHDDQLFSQIDSELPAERQKFIAEDSNARFVLSSSKLASFALFGDNVLDIDDPAEKDSINGQSTSDLQVAGPENLSYLLYTSGMFVIALSETSETEVCMEIFFRHYGYSQGMFTYP